MLRRILSHFASVVYVQIWENRLKVTDISTGEVFDDAPYVIIKTSDKGEKIISGIGSIANQNLASNEISVNPFSHPRVLFSDFYVGEKLLQYAFTKLSNIKSLRPRPKVIIHPMEKTEGGLTMIEKRAFRELAIGAGAIEVKLYTGLQLGISSLNFKDVEENEEFSPQQVSKSVASNVVVFIFYLVIVIFMVWHFGN
jgi:rod shape-determining protein MreB